MLRIFNRRPDLRAAIAGLERHEHPAATRDALLRFLEQAEERELYHTNPRYLAHRLDLDERAALRLLMAALHEGLFTLHWEVRCPFCGGTNHRGDSLAGLHHDDECAACHAHFAPRLDDEVRVSFSLHPRLRPLGPAADDPVFRAQIDAAHGVVSGQALLLLPDFQRLFPQQRLLPDESLDVARAALLFTDLAGSTALYARRGDPRAYHLVRLHFDELFREADEHGGLMIKTIGDAIMAGFATPCAALAAALSMQRAIAALNRRANLSGHEQLILKAGLHCGPCLSVTLNDRPDYFGTTVNIAARVQGLSHGDDIVFSEAVRADPETQPLLAGYTPESRRVQLRGIDEEVLVHRIVIREG